MRIKKVKEVHQYLGGGFSAPISLEDALKDFPETANQQQAKVLAFGQKRQGNKSQSN